MLSFPSSPSQVFIFLEKKWDWKRQKTRHFPSVITSDLHHLQQKRKNFSLLSLPVKFARPFQADRCFSGPKWTTVTTQLAPLRSNIIQFGTKGTLMHPLSIWKVGNGTEDHTSKVMIKFKDKPQRMNRLTFTDIQDDQLWILPLTNSLILIT